MLAGSGEEGDKGCQGVEEETMAVSKTEEDENPREEEVTGAEGRGFELDIGGARVIGETGRRSERKRDGVLMMREMGSAGVGKEELEKFPSYPGLKSAVVRKIEDEVGASAEHYPDKHGLMTKRLITRTSRQRKVEHRLNQTGEQSRVFE